MANMISKVYHKKLLTCLGIVLEVTLLGLINGEVEFCLEFDSKYISENEGSLRDVPALLKQAGKEIENAIQESGLNAETGNYDDIPLNFSHPAITLQGNFTNGTTITNDQTIRLWTIKEDGLEIFNLTFPYIFMNGSYNVSGYVGAHNLFNIYGNGTFNFNVTNLTVAAVTGLNINSSALCIPLSVNVYLNDYQSYFFNFMNGDVDLEPLLNGDIQAIVPEAVPLIFRETLDKTDPYIQAIINKLLHGSPSKALSKLLYILANNKNQLESIFKNT